ncbi:MAG: hypothetical protein ACR2HZ_09860 [Gemmatimonadaceae bacterium]
MRRMLLLGGLLGSLSATPALAVAQSVRPLPEAAAVFDTATARLVDLELELLRMYAQGRSEAHADAARAIRQIAALKELLASSPDSGEVNAAVRAHLVRGLYARLAGVIVEQRLLAHQDDARQPALSHSRKEEQLLRNRLQALGEPEPQ